MRQAPHQDQKQEVNPLFLPWGKGKMHSAAGTQIHDLHKMPKAWRKLTERAVKNLKLQLQPSTDQIPYKLQA